MVEISMKQNDACLKIDLRISRFCPRLKYWKIYLTVNCLTFNRTPKNNQVNSTKGMLHHLLGKKRGGEIG